MSSNIGKKQIVFIWRFWNHKRSTSVHVHTKNFLSSFAKFPQHNQILFKNFSPSGRPPRVGPKYFYRMASGSSYHYTSGDRRNRRANHLISEKSPYLYQHAHNPVDWYPWGIDAFNKAVQENKLIFLSIGYSTCHWCHVMQRESFENQYIADMLNKCYVSIKVDREERPDIDKIYMNYVQKTTGVGGWPLNIVLTPTLEPLYGGTYFPPFDGYGRIGFKSLMELIIMQWKDQHHILRREAKEAMSLVQNQVDVKLSSLNSDIPQRDCWKKCFRQLQQNFEVEYGGFSKAPKFPQPVILNFLIAMYMKCRNTEEGAKALDMTLHTLRRMAYGGIHDHVGSGFARYSVDKAWHVPHFEKMLYDQALLASNYVDAYLISKDRFYADVADGILAFVGRDMWHKQGAFLSAWDADSLPTVVSTAKREGAYYLWSYNELRDLIDDAHDLKVFCHHFCVKQRGNVSPLLDPHREMESKNVLACYGTYEQTAGRFNMDPDEVRDLTFRCLNKLLVARNSRPKPSIDTKIVTAWNGLMLGAYAKAGFASKNHEYTEKAVKVANFIKNNLTTETGGIIRCCYADGEQIAFGKKRIPGFLEDYAFLIKGLIHLYEATFDSEWLEWAENLQDLQNDRFWDSRRGSFYNHEGTDLFTLVRDKEDQDGSEPSGNSVSVHNLVRLYQYLDRNDFKSKAEIVLKGFSSRLNDLPVMLPEMAAALILYHTPATQIFIAGDRDGEDTDALLDIVRDNFLEGRLIAIVDGSQGGSRILYKRHKNLCNLRKVQGKAAAYVCRDFACTLPVTKPELLEELLEKQIHHTLQESTPGTSSDNY